MQLVKLITPKRIKTLHCFFLTVLFLSLAFENSVLAQDNSPYSRFGIGDLVPATNMTNRGMGGLSAAYSDLLSINFNNPASYFNFQTQSRPNTSKISSGRIIFDVGMNFEQRKLDQKSPSLKFTANNALFSYAYLGMPLRKNWGLAFGLRPVSRISYKIFRNERLYDPNTGLPIDSATTRFEGDGGSYLANLGTGFTVFKRAKNGLEENLSIGINTGYYFGKRDYSSKRTLVNDTVEYFQANYQTKTSFGNLWYNAGFQYRNPISKHFLLSIGAYGTLGQELNARQDNIRETFYYDQTLGDLRLDSVSEVKDVKGKIKMPATYTGGIVLQKLPASSKEGSWLIGVDLNIQNWDNFRVYGAKDSVHNNWQLRIGGQVSPAPGKGYFSNVAYRAGVFFGPDYISVGNKLPVFGISGGMYLPIKNQNRLTPYQASVINLGFEYIRRGNNSNLVRENLFRLSLGFSLSDFWFIKRRYD
jgi:hypothetical protein